MESAGGDAVSPDPVMLLLLFLLMAEAEGRRVEGDVQFGVIDV